MIKIMVSAGEVSGDLHGAALVQELKKINPSAYILGMGGPKMASAGADILIDLSPRGTVGLVEIIKHIPFILSGYLKMRACLRKENPDILVLIDYQGFNMMLASYAKKLGIKTVYYIAPQEWLWGTPKGIANVVKTIGKILAVFDDEARIYKEAGGNVVYVGNPNLDTAKPSSGKDEFCRSLGLNPKFPLIGLFPGSRKQEVESLLPIISETALIIRNSVPNAQFVMALSSGHFRSDLESAISKSGLPIALLQGKSHDIMAHSNVVIASSGTAILEAAILNTPAVMIYKLSPLTFYVAKNIVKIKLRYYCMPNLIANKPVVPELVQEKANPALIADAALKLLTDPRAQKEIKYGYAYIRSRLGSPGAVKRAASEIYAELKGKI